MNAEKYAILFNEVRNYPAFDMLGGQVKIDIVTFISEWEHKQNLDKQPGDQPIRKSTATEVSRAMMGEKVDAFHIFRTEPQIPIPINLNLGEVIIIRIEKGVSRNSSDAI